MTTEVSPLALGLFSVPGSQIAKYPGLTISAPYVVCAYLVRHEAATILFDTGIAGDAEAVERYSPRGFELEAQLDALGVAIQDVDIVVNCHLHADHAGGNHLFPSVPIVVQEAELAAAVSDYTIREAALDFPDAELQVVNGGTELVTGVSVVPTPGHSPGHQSLLVGNTADGTLLLAGQAFDSASELALAVLAHQLGGERDDVASPDWIRDLLATGVQVARFAHDLAEWRPPSPSFRGATPVTPWGPPQDQALSS